MRSSQQTGSSTSARKVAAGGQIVAKGRPEQVAKVPASHTGQFLARVLSEQFQ